MRAFKDNKSMSRFVRNVLFLSIVILCIVYLYNMAYHKLAYEEDMYSETKFNSVPKDIQICNFGSSHGVYGFDYSEYLNEYNTFNFALTSQTLSYDYLILQQYEDYLADNGVMFIVISYFSFGNDEEAQEDFNSKNERYYSFLKPQYVKQHDWWTRIKVNYLNVLYQNPGDIVLNVMNSGNKQQESRSVGSEDFDYQKDAENAFKRHYFVDDNGNMLVREQEINALYGMIDICRKHGIRPILVTTPFRNEYNKAFDEKFYEQYYALIQEICDNCVVEYWDYSHDERFVDSYEYEWNADHLSGIGARYFTQILLSDVL